MHGGEVIRIDALWLATQPIDMRASERLAVRLRLRLPMHLASRIEELLPHRWQPLGWFA